MITQELVDRINYLSRKKRTEGLTPEEAEEQKKVREEYLAGIKAQVRDQMDGLGIPKKEHKHTAHDKNCSCVNCDCDH